MGVLRQTIRASRKSRNDLAPSHRELVIARTRLGPISHERLSRALARAFRCREIRFDPYQLVAVAQRLTKAGLAMIEFPQTVGNLTEASSNLFELIKGANLVVYPDKDIRLAVSRAVAVKTSRGWRIAKEKASAKIDVVVALAQAAFGAVQGQHGEPNALLLLKRENARQQVAAGATIDQAATSVGIGVAELSRWLERPIGAQSSSVVVRSSRENIEAFEHGVKLMCNGMTAEHAVAETFKVHRVEIPVESLRSYHAKSIVPTAPSRPLYAPAGARRLET
jgi:hypothetical protein